jgi:hypothetical protein
MVRLGRAPDFVVEVSGILPKAATQTFPVTSSRFSAT